MRNTDAPLNIRANLNGVISYFSLLTLGAAVVLIVLRIGGNLEVVASLPPISLTPTPNDIHVDEVHVDVVLHVLGTLATVILVGAILGKLCQQIGQPPVIGEIIAGLALGPSLLGVINPEAMHLLIPTSANDPKGHVAISLKVIAQLGVILYMFLVGLELNAAQLKKKAHVAVAISHASIVVPFALGTVLSLGLYSHLSGTAVPFVSFSLFLGVAMSITAFPVLARILTDRNLQNTPIGTVALSCAAAGRCDSLVPSLTCRRSSQSRSGQCRTRCCGCRFIHSVYVLCSKTHSGSLCRVDG